MTADAHFVSQFYGSARGAVTARLLRDRLQAFWPSAARQAVLGIGYAAPYLRLWREESARCIALVPGHLGAARWPAGAPNLSCTADEDELPFADLSFDRVLLVHGLETAENARRLLREVWRVLKDDGRLIIVVPNRSGMWAYWDSTPFGFGQPYSTGQVSRLLAGGLFRVERRDACLWMPPLRSRLVLRSAPLIERAGRRLMPGLAGVTLTEAVKDVYAAMPVQAVPRRLVLADAA
ncbi:class I SAM-dependent methyltransferase [Rhodopila sp.]|jgi:SAM-dependent methyltransferase|uniref:class I SAM-dependent methyltransferase n=1 Tax=Rhodopila sp. TaxID=2480087 RepID=UPI002CAAC539|nr:class I SAM-dependent methyltransferase [Rhodopila sp.]HVZ07633.1 class I SAM-dependent methyltransferase [Rhodopila sp.]